MHHPLNCLATLKRPPRTLQTLPHRYLCRGLGVYGAAVSVPPCHCDGADQCAAQWGNQLTFQQEEQQPSQRAVQCIIEQPIESHLVSNARINRIGQPCESQGLFNGRGNGVINMGIKIEINRQCSAPGRAMGGSIPVAQLGP